MKAFLRFITLTTALALWLVFPGFAAEPEGLGPDKWPTTVQDTVKDILPRMPEKDKELVRKTKGSGLIMFHHGWGTGIRNYYGLWRGNKKLITSACGMPCHPDDASMIIINPVNRFRLTRVTEQNFRNIHHAYHHPKKIKRFCRVTPRNGYGIRALV